MVNRPQDQEINIAYHSALKECQFEYRRIIAEAVNNIKKEASKNTKSLFAMINSAKKPKEQLPKKMTYANRIITSNSEKAIAFHEHFTASMTSTEAEIADDTVYDIFANFWSGANESLWLGFTNSVSTEDADSAIQDIDPGKSPGSSSLTVKTAKMVSPELAKLMTGVINTIFDTSIVPRCWKEALLHPIPKKRNKKEIINYRGIAMQSVVSKIIDRIITQKLTIIISQLIPDVQHGFMKSRSTTTNLLEITSYINNSLASKLSVDVIYFDIAKAFDQLDHFTLIAKLAKLGTPFNILKLISNYITRRLYNITFEGNIYLSITSNCGVPQGSHIGPLLFLAFCTDVVNYVSFGRISQYADDTKHYTCICIKNESDVTRLQADIDNFSRWCADSRLKINETKSTHVLYSRSKNKPWTLLDVWRSYYVNGVEVCTRDTVQDLGVIFDLALNFKPQFANVVLRATQLLGFVWRKKNVIKNRKMMVILFKSIVLPVIEYAFTVWMSPIAPEMKLIEHIQRKFRRMVLKIAPNPSAINYMDYNKRLVTVELLSIDQRLKIAQTLTAKKLKRNPEFVPTLNDYININLNVRNVRTQRAFVMQNVNTNFALRQPLSALQHTFNTYQYLFTDVEALCTTRTKLKNHFREINQMD